MQYLLSLLPALACPLMMGGMMWMMVRAFKSTSTATPTIPEHSGNTDKPQDYQWDQPSWQTKVPAHEERHHSSLLASIGHCISMCLNWKVIIALVIIALGIWAVAPQTALAALPVLIAIICPLSMLFMMGGMFKSSRRTKEQHQHACCAPHVEPTARPK
jgi:Protein of unknown function (DUF2933).